MEQSAGSLLPHSRTPRYVVDCIAHKSEDIDHLLWRRNTILAADSVSIKYLGRFFPHARLIDKHIVSDQLSIILVGSHHIGNNPLICRLPCHSPYYIIGLKTRHFEYGNVHRLDNLFDYRHTPPYVLRGFLSLGLVLRKNLMPKGLSFRIKSHRNVCGLFLFNNLLQGFDKAKYGRCVLLL